MRLLLKVLAVVVGLFGAVLALGNLSFLAYFAFGNLPEGITHTARNLVIGYLALVVLFGGLGYYFLRSGWKHLRKPDLNSANNVSGSFCFILGLWLLTLVTRNRGKPNSPDLQDPTLYLAYELGVIVGCYLFYRLVLKRLAARAFPVSDTPPTPMIAGS